MISPHLLDRHLTECFETELSRLVRPRPKTRAGIDSDDDFRNLNPWGKLGSYPRRNHSPKRLYFSSCKRRLPFGIPILGFLFFGSRYGQFFNTREAHTRSLGRIHRREIKFGLSLVLVRDPVPLTRSFA